MPEQSSESKTIVVNWCGYGNNEGCGYVCTEGTDYCHHCGHRPVERVLLSVYRYLGTAEQEGVGGPEITMAPGPSIGTMIAYVRWVLSGRAFRR